jgi:uncharacterized protein (DUF983 family)
MIASPEHCDKCGRRGRVFRSRARKLGYRFRKRKCPVCGHEWDEFSSRINPARVLRLIARRRAKAAPAKRN